MMSPTMIERVFGFMVWVPLWTLKKFLCERTGGTDGT